MKPSLNVSIYGDMWCQSVLAVWCQCDVSCHHCDVIIVMSPLWIQPWCQNLMSEMWPTNRLTDGRSSQSFSYMRPAVAIIVLCLLLYCQLRWRQMMSYDWHHADVILTKHKRLIADVISVHDISFEWIMVMSQLKIVYKHMQQGFFIVWPTDKVSRIIQLNETCGRNK